MSRTRRQDALELLSTGANGGCGSGLCCDGYVAYYQFLATERYGHIPPIATRAEEPPVVEKKPDDRRRWKLRWRFVSK